MSNTNTNSLSYVMFHFINLSSMGLSILIFKIFHVMRQNFLIRTSSVICFIISVVMFIKWPLDSLNIRNEVFCSVQALILNYCFISVHAHFCFVMWNNLVAAMGWKIIGIKDPNALVGLMFFVSIAIPVVPTIIILAMSLDPKFLIKKSEIEVTENIFDQKAFFCVINEPAWLGYRLWFILFSGPGIAAACFLFYKTIESRQKMLQYSNTSQFGKMQLARMFVAILTYLFVAVLSVVLGFIKTKNHLNYSDFLPAAVGFLLFITYGVGSTATEYYKKIYVSWGHHLGFDIKERTTLKSSVVGRRVSSIKCVDVKSRRSSKLSENTDEEFIYDLPTSIVKKEHSQSKVPYNQILKRNRARRGSDPSTQFINIFSSSSQSTFENIPENDNEDEE